MARRRTPYWFAALILLPGSLWLSSRHWAPSNAESTKLAPPLQLPVAKGMVLLPAGAFTMGSLHDSDQDAQPLHRVRLDSFWLDATPVTNRQFQKFVDQTQYVTEAEQKGSSLVFDRTTGTWNEVSGANWRHPENADSSLVGRERHPVVHITWRDAVAYAAWADKRLPTEAEWEYAARAGLNDCDYPWGRELTPGGEHRANGWQGHFPQQDLALDGYAGTSPVEHFPPSRFRLHDIVGNVCCWCADWYGPDYYGASPSTNPRGPSQCNHRVRRGGSWLSAADHHNSFRVSNRDHAPPRESTNHTGFRCARDEQTP